MNKKKHFEIIKGGVTVLLAVFILVGVAKAGLFEPLSDPGPTMRPLSDLPTATEIWNSATRTLTSFGTLVADIVSGVWNKKVSDLDTDESIGKLIVDNLDQPLSSTESNIRGTDSDTLKTLSEQIDNISGGGLDSDVWTNTKASYLDATISSRSTLSQSDILSDATPFQGANIDATISSRATQSDILSDTTPFKGGDIDAPISSRAAQSDILSDATPFQGSDISSILSDTSSTKSSLIGSYDASDVIAKSDGSVMEQLKFIQEQVDRTPDGGTAIATDVFSGKTVHLTEDWDLDTGTLTLACDIDDESFDGTSNKVADAYAGGDNRWCIKNISLSKAAGESDICDGKKAWVGGVLITGTADCN